MKRRIKYAMMKNQEFLKRIRLLLFIGLLLIRGVRGYLTVYPLNSAVDIGSNTTFQCSSQRTYITWIYTSHGDHYNAPRTILTDPNCNVYSQYANHFRTSTKTTSYSYTCNLTLSNARFTDGGYYTCVDSYDYSYYRHSILVVIDLSTANMISNKSQEIINRELLYIGNSISYGGPWPNSNGQLVLPPVFKWTTRASPSSIISSSYFPTWNKSSSYFTITARQPVVPSYVCTLFFNQYNLPSNCANNLPSYTLNWTTQETPVSYIYPPTVNSTYYVESSDDCEARILRCFPNAYPPPTVQWTDMKSMETFDIESITAQFNGTYKCTTSNTIRGEKRSESTTYTVSDYFARTPCKLASSDTMEIILPDGSSCDNGTCFSPSCSKFILRCKVTATPSAIYKWTYGEGEEAEGDTVEASEDGNYTCRAYNAVNGRISSATKSVIVSGLYVPVSKYDMVIILGVFLGVSTIINIVLIVLLIVFCLRLKPTSQKHETNEGQYEISNRQDPISLPSSPPPLSTVYEAIRKESVYANIAHSNQRKNDYI